MTRRWRGRLRSWTRTVILVCLGLSIASVLLLILTAFAEEPWRASMQGLDYRLTVLETTVAKVESRELWILIAIVSNLLGFIVSIGRDSLRNNRPQRDDG